MSTEPSDGNRALLQETAARLRWLNDVRPGALGALLLKVLGPDERRRIIRTADGLRVYLDPFSHLGRTILENGSYEPETAAVLRRCLRTGATFLDVGANEGYFSALAATLVGPQGYVIAVEPQRRLCDIVEINLRINGASGFRVFNHALGGEDGERGTLNLWPSFNTGSSSIVVRYRFSRTTQDFAYISIDTLMHASGLEHLDLIKVDVEGFEGRVVEKLLPWISAGRVRWLLLDYHEKQLQSQGIEPRSIHDSLVRVGCRPDAPAPDLRSYVLYDVSTPR